MRSNSPPTDDASVYPLPQQAGISSSQPYPAASQPAAGDAPTAGLARAQLDNIYAVNPPHAEVANQTATQQAAGQLADDSVYNREHSEAGSYDWNQYHAAWQQYYQQYYAQYYNAELQKQQLLNPQAPTALTGESTSQTNQRQAAADALRQELTRKVKSHARRVRASSHFIPVLTALIVGGLFFFLQYNKVLAAEVNSYISPSSTVSDNVIVDPNANTEVGSEPRLIIPKINVDVPIVYGLTSLDNDSTQKLLENGVVHYPIPGANSMPGQKGNNVILGHSSNDVLVPGNFKFAFVLLERLKPGDLFYIHHEKKRFIYRISRTEVILPTEVSKLVLPNDKPVATLVTCVPIGTSKQRLLVFADQISPDPSAATDNKDAGKNGRQSDIPGNEPSLFQRVFGL
ncbi:sortase [Candidatus Saccharibacteria bacterium]|nr:sortase [Candidatus Saccharibacteria bacterium]